MFRRRLTWFWILLTAVALVIVGRLTQIQIVQAAQYEELAQRLLTRPVRYINAPRGSILDRSGRALLSDEPSSNITIHYGALAGQPEYFARVARALRKRGDYPADVSLAQIAARLEHDAVPQMWERLAELTGHSASDLRNRAAEVCARVDRVRAAVQRRSPKIQRIAEEEQLLPVLEDVDHDVALAVRLELEDYPWLRVMPDSRRVAHDADAVAHLLGRLGAASPERIAADPLAEDELRRLRPEDRCGVSGMERVADTSLRGQRGRLTLDYAWQPTARIDPVPGHNVQLTIDLGLQEHVLSLLEEAVRECVNPAGAAAVVVDVATREVRALVSYPTYSVDRYNAEYETLQRDARRLPLMFRAVQAQYAPGSICKAITLVGGLSDGIITPETRFHCTGYLLPDKPDRFRCWIYNQHPGLTHDMSDDPAGQNGESAVRNSCNIYFYQVGGKLGAARLCEWFGRFGLGQTAGTGLIEESPGIVPTEEWLRRTADRGYQPSDAWNFAIGQGEVTITPLQAANVATTIASGQWAPVRLAYDETGHAFGAPPAPPTPFDPHALQVLRRGMWRVVNEPGGTAPQARLERDDYELCGKTGSAQTAPRPVTYRYTFEWPDGHRETADAYLEEDALAQFLGEPPRRVGKHVVEQYPALHEGEKLPAHAWFIGYTQPKQTPRGGTPSGRVYAISVLVEFGESGGHVAGPVARKIAEYLLE